MAPVAFWSAPRAYCQWAVRAKPAIFWSMILGGMGPVFVVRPAPIIAQGMKMTVLQVLMRECGSGRGAARQELLWRWAEAADSVDISE